MIYSFNCISPDHKNPKTRKFDHIFHGLPPEKIVNQYECSECGGLAKRDFGSEIPTQALVGLQSISHASTTKGTVFGETHKAFGRFEKNPDGSENKNAPRFKDTGELNKYMNGANELGDPVTNDKGEPVKRPDGTIVRRGAKCFKYSAGATPSKTGLERKAPVLRRGPLAPKWVTDRQAQGFGDNNPRTIKSSIYNGK